MPIRKLPPELVSLVHHIELNKAGWWELGLQRLILATIWISNAPVSGAEVHKALRDIFSIDADVLIVQAQIKALLLAKTLFEVPGSGLKISEQSLAEFEKALATVDEIERKTKLRFGLSLIENGIDLLVDDVWKQFQGDFLMPLIREEGARAYQLITGAGLQIEGMVRFSEFLSKHPEAIRDRLQTACVSFLNPKIPEIKSYILASLNSYFFIEAGNLSSETISIITQDEGTKPKFVIFVDTNFLFSILSFHDNPSNEAAESLTKLIGNLPAGVECKLYALPSTIDEAKRSIEFHSQRFKYINLSPNLAAGAMEVELSGIAKQYISECNRLGRTINAEDYFGPYLSNLIPILKSKGVEIYNQPLENYGARQDVIDDIIGQLEYQKARQPRRTKSYEDFEHDVILWHFAMDKRPAHVESPQQARFFVVTIDYRFLGFDSFKQRHAHLIIPVCVHPTSLIQLLRFWLPRTSDLDDAVIESLKWKFLFRDFDPKAEGVTIQILEALSRFEDVTDLPTEAVRAILIDNVLRQKLLAEKDIRKHIDIVKEALIEQGVRAGEKLKEAEAEAARLRLEVIEHTEVITKMQSRIQEKDIAIENAQRQGDVRERNYIETQTQLNIRLNRLESQRQLTKEILKVISASILLLAFEITTSIVAFRKFGSQFPRNQLILLLVCTSAGLWIWIVDNFCRRQPTLRIWKHFAGFHNVAGKVIYGIGAIILGALGNALYEFVKNKKT